MPGNGMIEAAEAMAAVLVRRLRERAFAASISIGLRGRA
jgi:hypothetical protein